MRAIALSQARVRALSPGECACDLRDPKLRGFGVRVLPSGAKRFFIHTQHRGQRFWKTVGDTNNLTLAEARTNARTTLRYAHLADEDVAAAAERIGAGLARLPTLEQRHAPASTRSSGTSGPLPKPLRETVQPRGHIPENSVLRTLIEIKLSTGP